MKFFRTCPVCKSHLDLGERCDCEKKDAVNRTSNSKAFVFTAEYQRMKQELIANLS